MTSERSAGVPPASAGTADNRAPVNKEAGGTPTPHKGWHGRGYLPHFDEAGRMQHVVFRLHGSLPKVLLDRLDAEKVTLEERRDEVGAALDSAHGPRWLAEPAIARMVIDALRHFDGDRYRLIAWCVMPNHVHVIIKVLDSHALSAVVQAWKSFTAKIANRLLSREGPFWAADYFDRYVRDQEQLAAVVEYVEANPVKAGLCVEARDWPWSSARTEA